MAGGAAFGTALVLIAWRVAIANSGQLTFAELHTLHPMMWIIDLLPTVLGLAASAIGYLHWRLIEQRKAVEHTARQIAASWTADLHAANAELAEAMEARQRHYSALSHELRTPLSSIVGYSQLAEEIEIQPPELSDYMAEIYGSARALLQMVNDLLDAAKLEMSGVSIKLETVDGNAVAEEAARCLAPLAAQKSLRLVTKLEAVDHVRADPIRLRQVLTNLLSNAIKYSDRGTITLESGRSSNGSVSFAVRDEGAGIAAEDLERIFRPFEQTEHGERRTDSTGLGLTITRTFVEAMDGTITAHSPGPGLGATFSITLPVDDGSAAGTRTAVLNAAG